MTVSLPNRRVKDLAVRVTTDDKARTNVRASRVAGSWTRAVHLRATRYGGQPLHGLPTVAHALVGKRERMVAEREGFEPPCRLPGKTLSRRPRYDHFGTSPFITSLRARWAPRCALAVRLRRTSLRRSLAGAANDHRDIPDGFVSRWSSGPLRSLKNSCINARLSASSTPPSASIRWFSAG
jgi:hypothetical protein